jgi:hypothetical protein
MSIHTGLEGHRHKNEPGPDQAPACSPAGQARCNSGASQTYGYFATLHRFTAELRGDSGCSAMDRGGASVRRVRARADRLDLGDFVAVHIQPTLTEDELHELWEEYRASVNEPKLVFLDAGDGVVSVAFHPDHGDLPGNEKIERAIR